MSSAPLRSSDVAIGLLTENAPRMLTQAIRLVRSIRWFGGDAANSRVVVCAVNGIEDAARKTLENLGAEIRLVTRFHPANPTGNRQQLLAEMLDAREELLLILDCDTLVVRDPLPHLTRGAFQAKIAPAPTVTDEVFDRLFAHFQLAKPPKSFVAPLSNTPTIPYFNAGVIAVPTALLRTLAPSWRRFNQALADRPELASPCERHLHQAALALALAETKVPLIELPDALNYQINTPQLAQRDGFDDVDPVIVHYHHLATPDGYLLPTRYPLAQKRIDAFHARLRAEGIEPAPSTTSAQSRPILVLGMHRSGTSVITELIASLGSYAGRPDKLGPPDLFNPTGYWEHREVVQLDTEFLDAPDVERFAPRAKEIAESLQGHAPSFVVKDPRMCLAVPLWRNVLDQPVCVIAWREPMAVARSLMTRDRKTLLHGLASWEHHTRAILRDTEGLPRVIVSYEALIAEPYRVARELHAQLTSFGIEGLTLPGEERVRQIVNPDFNRSRATDDSLLDDDQRALVADLRSGAALTKPIAPLSARNAAVLEAFDAAERREQALRRDVKELDSYLEALFGSRSWRVGHGLTGLLRVLRRGHAISAYDRWQEHKRRRLSV